MKQLFRLMRLMVLIVVGLFFATSDVFAMQQQNAMRDGKYSEPTVNRNILKDTRQTDSWFQWHQQLLERAPVQEKLFDYIANLLTGKGKYVREILGSEHDAIRAKIHPHMKRSDKDLVTLLGRTIEIIIWRNKLKIDRKETQNVGAEIDAEMLKFFVQSGVKYVPSGDNKRFETMSIEETHDEMWSTLIDASTNPSDASYKTYIGCILETIFSERELIELSFKPLLGDIGKMLEDKVVEPDAYDVPRETFGDITSSRNNSPERRKKEDKSFSPKHTSPKCPAKENKEPGSPNSPTIGLTQRTQRLSLSPKRRLLLDEENKKPSVSEEVCVQELEVTAEQQEPTADTELDLDIEISDLVDEGDGDTPKQCDEPKEPVTELGALIDELCEKNAQYDAQYVACYNEHEAMLKEEAREFALKIRSLMKSKVAYVPALQETVSETADDSYEVMIERLHEVADKSKKLSLVNMLFQSGLLARSFLLYDQSPYHCFDHLIALFTESCLRIDDAKIIERDEDGAINWYVYLEKFWQAMDRIIAQLEEFAGVDKIHEVTRDEKTPETFLAGVVEYIVRNNVEYRDMPEDKLKIMADRYVAILLYFVNKEVKYVSQFDLKYDPKTVEKMSLEASYKSMASTLTRAADGFKAKKLAYFITRHLLFETRFEHLFMFNREMDHAHYNPEMPDTLLQQMHERGDGRAGYHLTSRRAERAKKAAKSKAIAWTWGKKPRTLKEMSKAKSHRTARGYVRGR